MTTTQSAAIKSYTESGYRHINRNLLKGVTTPEATTLAEALATVTPVAATTFRGMNIDEVDSYFVSLKKGETLSFATFLSTSKSQAIAEKFGNVQFTITGKSGRDIANLSDAPAEQEVLFPAGATFVIKAVKATKVAGRVFKIFVTISEI